MGRKTAEAGCSAASRIDGARSEVRLGSLKGLLERAHNVQRDITSSEVIWKKEVYRDGIAIIQHVRLVGGFYGV
jgi:hypothetical protein